MIFFQHECSRGLGMSYVMTFLLFVGIGQCITINSSNTGVGFSVLLCCVVRPFLCAISLSISHAVEDENVSGHCLNCRCCQTHLDP